MTSKMVAAEIKKQTGVSVGVRTLIINLGHKTDAVEKAERVLRRPKPMPLGPKPKAKAKRRKPAKRTQKEPAHAD
jgi:hypothetical protein